MPAGWMHAVIDLAVFGMPYLEIHQKKDAPARRLGPCHRSECHDWYNAGRAGLWTLEHPSPSWLPESIRAVGDSYGDVAAEEYMVDLTHDHWDLFWDRTSKQDRQLIEGLFAWILFRPDILGLKFGVDVIHGRNERLIDGHLRWMRESHIIVPYRRLCRYVRCVLANDPDLQAVVDAYDSAWRRLPDLDEPH